MSTSPAEQHAHDAERFGQLVAAARPEDWAGPSPVKEWTAIDVVKHLVEWLPGFLGGAGVTLPEVDVDADPAAAWRQRSTDVQRVIEEQGSVTYSSPMFGDIPVAEAVDRFYTADVWMHSWDLSRALGQEFDLGEERAKAALAGMEPIEEMLRQSGQFGQRVHVPDSATAQERFVAFIGRDPSWRRDS